MLGARVRDYEPSYLDELTASGEVLWAGHAALPGADGWVSLHLADQAPLTLPDPRPSSTASCTRPCSTRSPPAARGSSASSPTRSAPTDDRALSAALWELVWAGRISNDTLTPLRALTRGGTPAHRSRRPPPRPRMSSTTGPRPDAGPHRAARRPPAAGRCCPRSTPTPPAGRTPPPSGCSTGTASSSAAPSMSERVPGGFAAVYKVLSAFEDSGRCRRGYFVDGLGAAQFGTAGAIDRLRTFARAGRRDAKPSAVALAATDPANPYGAALPWPDRSTPRRGHRGVTAAGTVPAARPGALVVLVDGALTLYVERGGRTLLTWSDDPDLLTPAAAVAGRGRAPRLAGPADRREGRRRAAARRRADAAARGAARGRLRLDPEGCG